MEFESSKCLVLNFNICLVLVSLLIKWLIILVMFAGRNRKLMTKTTSTISPITSTTTTTKVG